MLEYVNKMLQYNNVKSKKKLSMKYIVLPCLEKCIK